MKRARLVLLVIAAASGAAAAQGTRADYERAQSLGAAVRGVRNTQLTVHWLDGGERLWYSRRTADGKEFVAVACASGERAPLFDHARLAQALAAAAGESVRAEDLPFDEVEVTDGGAALRFVAFGCRWTCALADYACSKGARQRARERPQGRRGRQPSLSGDRPPRERPAISSDRAWQVFARDHDLWLQTASDGSEKRLTDDGTEELSWGRPAWSPDSRHFVAYRITPNGVADVPLIETSPDDQLEAKLHLRPYARPGDVFPAHAMHVFDVASGARVAVAIEPIDFHGPPRLRWRADGRSFVFEKRERGHQRVRILEVDAASGFVRTLLDERATTFLDHYHKHTLQWLGDADAFVWASERDGWNHLYLYDARGGGLRNRITSGEWVVRGVEHVDEQARQLWFAASGTVEGQDPYLVHHYRIGLDGQGLLALTEGDGTHALQWSPDRRYYIDTWSRADCPPVRELRAGADGKRIAVLEEADIGALREAGVRLPEVFRAKGRDGETDIWGVIVRPTNFDPDRSYPVIENIYAGPHDSHVPKRFAPLTGMHALAELGFVVVQIDGMGTNNRSKKFLDVCWKNIADAGFPDRIAWLRAAATRYPQLDLERVGIYGTSAGGQNALGALLFHPDFYKVGVAACGCHDNRLDKASWNEQWMGYPVGPHYEQQSNITNAKNLQGKLLLIVGELDTNVPPESTYRVVDALIDADKDFDLIVLPGAGHTSGGRYGERRRRDFFVRHLLGVEPRALHAPR